jgi:hypothetical protein
MRDCHVNAFFEGVTLICYCFFLFVATTRYETAANTAGKANCEYGCHKHNPEFIVLVAQERPILVAVVVVMRVVSVDSREISGHLPKHSNQPSCVAEQNSHHDRSNAHLGRSVFRVGMVWNHVEVLGNFENCKYSSLDWRQDSEPAQSDSHFVIVKVLEEEHFYSTKSKETVVSFSGSHSAFFWFDWIAVLHGVGHKKEVISKGETPRIIIFFVPANCQE